MTKYYKQPYPTECRETVMDSMLEQELVNRTTELLSILSKKDALAIFLLAKDGLKAETDTPQKIGLTRKQYYTRLKQLVDNGLVDKTGDIYSHTTLGTLIHERHLMALLEHVRNVKKMQMVDVLKRTRQFNEEEITNFIGKTNDTLTKVVEKFAYIAWKYEDMVTMIVERSQFAKNEILVSTRFLNETIINKVMLRAKSGVHTRVIADSKLIQNYFKEAGEKLNVMDKNALERVRVVANPWYPSTIQRRYADLPFSFVVFDGKEVAIELVDSTSVPIFKACMLVRDEEVARNFQEFYSNIWNNAEEDLTKLVGLEIISRIKSLPD